MTPGQGITNIQSTHSVDETVEILRKTLEERNVTLFCLVDHSGEAAKVGLQMRPTKLLIFGSPKAGTPAMLSAPSIALDLPLKLLVWEDAQGQCWISYNSAEYLRDRHGLPDEFVKVLAAPEGLAVKASQ